VLVTRGKELVGIITRSDLLKTIGWEALAHAAGRL
jgi:predicted transcriptional regulator